MAHNGESYCLLEDRALTESCDHCVGGKCWKPGAAKDQEHCRTFILFVSISSDFFPTTWFYDLGNLCINVRMAEHKITWP